MVRLITEPSKHRTSSGQFSNYVLVASQDPLMIVKDPLLSSQEQWIMVNKSEWLRLIDH